GRSSSTTRSRCSSTRSRKTRRPRRRAGDVVVKKLVRVRIRPRDLAQLALSIAEAKSAIARGFGAIVVDVSAVGVDDGAWSASIVVDGSKAAASDASLLVGHAADERLWKAFVEAACQSGACDVVSVEDVPATVSRSASSRPTR